MHLVGDWGGSGASPLKLSTEELLQFLGLAFREEAALWALLAGELVELVIFSS